MTLPALGESVTEGTVSRWLKQVGDTVEADEPLLEISTDKVDTEIPSPTAGTLLEIRVQEDETVEVGAVLAVVGDAVGCSRARRPRQAGRRTRTAEAPEPETAPKRAARRSPSRPRPGTRVARRRSRPRAEEPKPAAKDDPQPEQHGPSAPSRRSRPPRVAIDSDAGYVTPLVRKLAKEHSVDLASVTGTGVGGRIRKQDVLAAAEEAKKAAEAPRRPARAAGRRRGCGGAAAPAAEASELRGTTEKMSRLRKTIAKRMVESLQVSAQLTATVEVDLTAISRIRARAKDDFKAREGAACPTCRSSPRRRSRR